MYKASPKWAYDVLSVYITYMCTYCKCYTFVFRDLKHVIIKLLNNLHTTSSLSSSINNLASDIVCTFMFNFAFILLAPLCHLAAELFKCRLVRRRRRRRRRQL